MLTSVVCCWIVVPMPPVFVFVVERDSMRWNWHGVMVSTGWVMKQPSWDVNLKKNTSSIVGYSLTNINWKARICCIKSIKGGDGLVVDDLVGKFTWIVLLFFDYAFFHCFLLLILEGERERERGRETKIPDVLIFPTFSSRIMCQGSDEGMRGIIFLYEKGCDFLCIVHLVELRKQLDIHSSSLT